MRKDIAGSIIHHTFCLPLLIHTVRISRRPSSRIPWGLQPHACDPNILMTQLHVFSRSILFQTADTSWVSMAFRAPTHTNTKILSNELIYPLSR